MQRDVVNEEDEDARKGCAGKERKREYVE